MNRCILSGAAQEDLRHIGMHVARDNPSAAMRLVDKLQQMCERLGEMPGMGRDRSELGEGMKSFSVNPYLIFFRETEEGVTILRVLHGARDIERIFAEEELGPN